MNLNGSQLSEKLTTVKIYMKIATLICRGLNKDEKMLHLLHDADNYRLNVASLQETYQIKSLFFFNKNKQTRITTIILYISISIRYAQHVVHNKTFYVILHNV